MAKDEKKPTAPAKPATPAAAAKTEAPKPKAEEKPAKKLAEVCKGCTKTKCALRFKAILSCSGKIQ